MKEFKFTINQKVAVWQDVTLSVNAKSESEALKKIKNIAENEYDCADLDTIKYKDSVTVIHKEFPPEPPEVLTKTQNNGRSVRELYDSNGNVIHFNGE